jgi:hypothetical protein
MSSSTNLVRSHHPADPTTEAALEEFRLWLDGLLSSLNRTTRDDDELIDQTVRLYHLHPEVVADMRASKWEAGAGAPNPSLISANTKYWLNTDDWVVWQRSSLTEFLALGSIKGEKGEIGSTGIQGIPGDQGVPGAQGIPGEPGAVGAPGGPWLKGEGAPSELGSDGDWYLDTETGWVYGPKDGEMWPNLARLVVGPIWLSRAWPPSASEGIDGDMYLDYTSRKFYRKALGEWQEVGSLTGIEV